MSAWYGSGCQNCAFLDVTQPVCGGEVEQHAKEEAMEVYNDHMQAIIDALPVDAEVSCVAVLARVSTLTHNGALLCSA